MFPHRLSCRLACVVRESSEPYQEVFADHTVARVSIKIPHYLAVEKLVADVQTFCDRCIMLHSTALAAVKTRHRAATAQLQSLTEVAGLTSHAEHRTAADTLHAVQAKYDDLLACTRTVLEMLGLQTQDVFVFEAQLYRLIEETEAMRARAYIEDSSAREQCCRWEKRAQEARAELTGLDARICEKETQLCVSAASYPPCSERS